MQKAGYQIDRADLVKELTKGRTGSLRELTHIEYTYLINRMREFVAKRDTMHHISKDTMHYVSTDMETERKRMRSQVLAIATRTNLHDAKDWRKFNAFMKERSILKKPLNEYNLTELDALVRQFRGIEANYKKSAAQPGTKAWYHRHGFTPFSNQ